MTLQWLLGWWNLVFLVPFLIALTYLAVYVSTGITFGEADADADASLEHDVDADHGADHDAGHGGGHDLEHDLDASTGHGIDRHHLGGAHANTPSHGGAMSLLYLVGVGRVPLSILVMIFLIVWGIGGFATNQVLHKTIADGDRVGLAALPIAAVLALTLTGLIARALARAMPMNELPTMSLPQMVGAEGVAISPIGETFGLAKGRDGSGVSIQVPCRVAPGQEPIDPNEPVRFMRFDQAERIFYVTTPQRLATLNREGATSAKVDAKAESEGRTMLHS